MPSPNVEWSFTAQRLDESPLPENSSLHFRVHGPPAPGSATGLEDEAEDDSDDEGLGDAESGAVKDGDADGDELLELLELAEGFAAEDEAEAVGTPVVPVVGTAECGGR